MKKLTTIFLLLFSFNTFAQWSAAAIKLGSFSPGATDAGFIIGYEGGRYIDNNFNFGWGIDWFHKTYVDKKLVQFLNTIPLISAQENELIAKTNLHDIPVMVNATIKFPVTPRAKVYATGGIGAEVLIIDYRNFENPDKSKIKGAFDFNWRLGLGAAYDIGPRSEFLLEMAYHHSQPSWTYEVEDASYGKHTFERVYDMSGIMFRAGFRFYY